MSKKRIKNLFLFLVFFVIISLLGVLFQNDLIVIGNQVATDTGIVSDKPVSVFVTKGGYIQFVDEEQQELLHAPLLSEVRAKLLIPRLGILGPIVEGTDEKMLDLGFWHFPSASPFAEKGNVVIIGHRFLKLPPHRDTFYHLDWVKAGDEIRIETEEGTFTYIAREQKIVKTTDTYILQQTLNAQLTLITCHPLWTSAERLVIIADRKEATPNE